MLHRSVFALFGLLLFFQLSEPARSERPTAVELLPETTVGFLRIADTRELSARFRETSMGRILADEEIQPFVGHLYGSVLDAYAQVEDKLGASLDELLALPQGELCFALVLPEAGIPQAVFIADVGEQPKAANALLQRLDDQMIQDGAARQVEDFGEVELTIYTPPGERQRQLVRFERDGTLVFTTNADLSRNVLMLWEGDDSVRTFANNRKFASIMNRSKGLKDEPPQITWFVDPLEFGERVAQGNLSGQATLATLKGLGLDGLKALGGGIVFGTEEFEAVAQSHVLIGHPREGILNMIALKSGELIPESFVPPDAASYTTIHWDFGQTFGEVERLYDIFRGENAWQEQVVAEASRRLNVDFQSELLEAAEGRVSMISWIEKPARLNSQATMLAFKLKDANTFQSSLQSVVASISRFQTDSYRGTTYYRIERRNRRELDETLARRPQPCCAILGDYFVVTDSEKLLQEAIITKGDATKTLANELDFKIVLNKVQRQLGKTKAGYVSFQRPEEAFRLMYDLATSPGTRNRLQETDNPVFKALRGALEEHPLPAFSVLAKYLAPGGSMLTYDELGLHHTNFTLRRD